MNLTAEPGRPSPLGATPEPDGLNFAVFSRHATSVALLIQNRGGAGPDGEAEPSTESRHEREFVLDPRTNRTGDVWHVSIRGVGSGAEYTWKVEGPSPDDSPVHRFDGRSPLVDPYARLLTGAEIWAGGDTVRPRRSRVSGGGFDWGPAGRPEVHLADSIIYELHVRGFTRHPGSEVAHPGTFQGLVEKIPYLEELGITVVELMPVTEFEENDNPRSNPLSGERLLNYWGYHPISFFAPKSSYASDPRGDGPLRGFQRMVRAFHEAGIEVILDVVFNHTGEGDERGPTLCFRGLDNAVYYMLDRETGSYLDYSGTGNTFNCNQPVVQEMILDALRYWATEMRVDGFRFDLASILARDTDGTVLDRPPLLERIAGDPVLSGTKLIAEPWDPSGLYQVGTFPHWGRWAEWNGRFRDDLRRFVKGEPGMVSALASRLAGSSDLYREGGRAPYHSINFVACHDGFTLADLVSYDVRHNEANGEGGADGPPESFSWNCGEEGPSSSPEVNRLRRRQMKNLATLLLLSQGVPMILAGDELGRTQQGNNNAYCQDNAISWLDWKLRDRNLDLFRFFKLLIRFRKEHPALRRRRFFEDGDPEVRWHGVRLDEPDWSEESRSLVMHRPGGEGSEIYLIANAHWEPHRFALPGGAAGRRWFRFVDTMLEPPHEIREDDEQPALPDQGSHEAGPRSVVVLVRK